MLDQVVDDPDKIRQMARDNGPYWQPGRTIASSKAAVDVADNDGDDDDTDFTNAMVGPTFRGQWPSASRRSMAPRRCSTTRASTMPPGECTAGR